MVHLPDKPKREKDIQVNVTRQVTICNSIVKTRESMKFPCFFGSIFLTPIAHYCL